MCRVDLPNVHYSFEKKNYWEINSTFETGRIQKCIQMKSILKRIQISNSVCSLCIKMEMETLFKTEYLYKIFFFAFEKIHLIFSYMSVHTITLTISPLTAIENGSKETIKVRLLNSTTCFLFERIEQLLQSMIHFSPNLVEKKRTLFSFCIRHEISHKLCKMDLHPAIR